MKNGFLFLAILLLSASVNARVYPPKMGGNSEIFVVPGAEDDLFLKHRLMAGATKSIEMLTHLQTLGPVGGLVVEDLRKAMARGVKVKYFFEAIATMTGGGDFGLDSVPFLTEEGRYRASGSELITSRFGQRLKSPFAINDLIHKKILIIDRGTPNEIVVITGRNIHELNFTWSDLTFVIRRVSDNQPYIGDDIIKDFDSTWSLLRAYFQPEPPTTLTDKDKEKYSKISFRPLRPTEAGRQIDDLLKQKPKLNDRLLSYQFRPEAVRVITTDVLEQIAKKKLDKTWWLRNEIVDDVSDYLSDILTRAEKVEANIYAMLLTDKIRISMEKYVQRGGDLTILTNSAETLGSALPIASITEAIASYSAELLLSLKGKMPNPAADKVRMFAMLPKESVPSGAGMTATHRKLWVMELPNGKKLSLFGSHNFTTASSSKSDEIMISAIDNRMADYFYDLNRQEITSQYKRVTAEEANEKKSLSSMTRTMTHRLLQATY